MWRPQDSLPPQVFVQTCCSLLYLSLPVLLLLTLLLPAQHFQLLFLSPLCFPNRRSKLREGGGRRSQGGLSSAGWLSCRSSTPLACEEDVPLLDERVRPLCFLLVPCGDLCPNSVSAEGKCLDSSLLSAGWMFT